MQWFTFIVLAVVFLISPFQWGLFFEQHIHIWEWTIFILFIFNVCWYMVKNPELLLKCRACYLIFLLPLMYAVSATFAINPVGNAQTMIRFLMYACFFMLLIWTEASVGESKWFFYIFHALGVVFLIFAIANFYGFIRFGTSMVGCTPTRVCGPVRYPNTFGAIMGAYWFMTLAVIIYRKKFDWHIVFPVFLLIGYGMFLFRTYSRGSYLFFAVTLVLAALLMHRKWKRLLLAVGIVLVLVVGVSTVMNLHAGLDPVSSRDMSRFEDNANAAVRIDFYKEALSMSQHAPWFGFGGNSWPVYYPQHVNRGLGLDQVHNGYLDFLIEIGWVGLIVYAFVLGVFLYFIIQSRQSQSRIIAILLALAMLFGHAMVDYDLSYGTIWLMILWLLAMGLSGEKGRTKMR